MGIKWEHENGNAAERHVHGMQAKPGSPHVAVCYGVECVCVHRCKQTTIKVTWKLHMKCDKEGKFPATRETGILPSMPPDGLPRW